MAEQLKLVRTYDFQADISEVSLIGYTDGFNVAYEGWAPKTTVDKDGSVRESLLLRAQGGSADGLAANLQKLAQKAQEVSQFQESRAERYGVWLRVQMYGESKGRQSFVLGMEHAPASAMYEAVVRQKGHINEYRLGLRRTPWWEGTAAVTVSASSVSVLGGTVAYSAMGGDLPGRIAQAKVDDDGTAALFPNGQVWIGMRSNRFGAAGSFAPYWSLGAPPCPYGESVGVVAGGGSAVADAATRGGTRLAWAPTNTEREFVGGLATIAVTAAADEQRGEYLVLLRARLSAAGTVLAQLQTAWYDDYVFVPAGPAQAQDKVFTNARVFPRVAITSTDWHLYEMGRVSIPQDTKLLGQRKLDTFCLLLYAQRPAGTAAIYADGFVLVPLEGLVWLGSTGYSQPVSGGTVTAWGVNGPDGRQQSVMIKTIDWGYVGATAVPAAVGAATPVFEGGPAAGDSGILVVAAEAVNVANDAAHTVTVELKVLERWKELRGNE